MSNGWDPDHDNRPVGPDFGPNYLQRLYQQTIWEVATSRKSNCANDVQLIGPRAFVGFVTSQQTRRMFSSGIQ